MRHVRVLVAALLLAGAVVFGAGSAEAVRVPKTLVERVGLDGDAVDPPFPVDFLGVLWQGPEGGEVRFRHGSRWGPWEALVEDGAEGEGGMFASGLVAADDADAYQVRPAPGVRGATAVAINTTDGPKVSVGVRYADAAHAGTAVITRAGWGADESVRFDAKGNEIWAPDYHPVQKLTVHHTATRNADPDPAATIRAIYRYHAVDRGWGDIGYQYLVDESGRVYEGRWSGVDGEPGHDANSAGVTAAHVAGYNSGNLGVAVLGTLTNQAPTADAQDGLETVLADVAARHGLDPVGSGTYTNPVNGATKHAANISGHRDWVATECPGGGLYNLLPVIRTNVAGRMTTPSSTTTTTTSSTTTTVPSPDTSGPAVTNVRANDVRGTEAVIRWSTNEPADSQVAYWVWNSATSTSSSLEPTLVTSHEVKLTGLTPRTKYGYRVRSADASGNVAWSTTSSFSTKR